MIKRTTTWIIIAFAGFLLASGSAFAEPRTLSGPVLDNISGEEGIQNPKSAAMGTSAQQGEVNREILRRNQTTEYPVERTDFVFDQHNTLEYGKTSGKTIGDLFAEGEPGRLPQFFIDAANKEALANNPNSTTIPSQP